MENQNKQIQDVLHNTHPKKKKGTFLQFKMNNIPIRICSEVKYLGLVLDKKTNPESPV